MKPIYGRITTLLLLFIIGCGLSAADWKVTKRVTTLETGKKYAVYNGCNEVARRTFLTVNEDGTLSTTAEAYELETVLSDRQLWTLEDAADGAYYLKNVQFGTYYNNKAMAETGSRLSIENWAQETTTHVRDMGQAPTMGPTNEFWLIYDIDNNNHFNGNNGHNFTTWAGNGHPYAFFEVEDPDAFFDVTYTVYFEGEQTDVTQVVKHSAGGTSEMINDRFPSEWYDLKYTPEVIADNTVTEVRVDATLKENIYFKYFATFNDAKWYTLKLKNERYIKAGAENANVTTTPDVDRTDDTYLWTFIGDPYHGVTIYNKALGEAVVLSSADPTDDGNTGANTIAQMNNSLPEKLWFPRLGNTANNVRGFYLANSKEQRLNLRSNQLAYWTGGADLGSTFFIEEVSDNFANAILTEVLPVIDGATDSDFFTFKSSVVKEVWDEAYLSSATKEQYLNLLSIVQDPANYNLPPTGYYRLRNYGYTNKVMGLETTLTDGTATAGIQVKQAYDGKVSSIVKAELNEDNTYSFALQGKYLGDYTNGRYVSLVDESEKARFSPYFLITKPGLVALNITESASTATSITDLHYMALHAENGEKLTNWAPINDQNASFWTFEPVEDFTVMLDPIGDKSYTTFYVPFDIELSSDVEAYAVTVIGDKAMLTSIGQSVPAATPVVLISNSAEEEVLVYMIDPVAETVTTDLQGTYLPKEAEFDNLTLGMENDAMGFYSGLNVEADHAYLPWPGGGENGLVITFDDITGLKDIKTQTADKLIVYDLQGRRVSRPVRGVYIVGRNKKTVK